MKAITASALLSFTIYSSSIAQAVVTFEWAVVGNPGNAADTEIKFDGTTGYGSVDYVYRIGKHEVTNDQYTEFLNAVDPNGIDTLKLYNSEMSGDDRYGGITFDAGVATGSKYEVKTGRHNNPVSYVSFFDAMRFVNWLENGQGGGSTESGVYTITDGLSEIRSMSATFSLPSEDEWYKAAYHKNDGITGNYWDYPTGTDTEPYSDNPDSLNTPDDTNVANFKKNDSLDNGYDDGYAVTGSITVQDVNILTDVGAYSQSASPYGTFDQGGNVSEWHEGVIAFHPHPDPKPLGRGILGGSAGSDSIHLAASSVGIGTPNVEVAGLGFRIASVPEPATLLLTATASVGLLLRRGRKKVREGRPLFCGISKACPVCTPIAY